MQNFLKSSYSLSYVRSLSKNRSSPLIDSLEAVFRVEQSETVFPYLYRALLKHADADVEELHEIVGSYIKWVHANCEVGSVLFYTPESTIMTAGTANQNIRLKGKPAALYYSGNEVVHIFDTSVHFDSPEMLTAFRLTFGL